MHSRVGQQNKCGTRAEHVFMLDFFLVQLGLFVKTAHNTSYLATYEVGSATRVLLALSAFTSRGRTGTKSLPTHKGAKGNANEPFYTSTGYLYTTTSPTVRPL